MARSRECVLLTLVLFARLTKALASTLLHLVHPYAFQNLKEAITHVKRFRDELDPLPPRCESAQIAKDILMDAADSSGVDLKSLLHVLDEIKSQLKYSGGW